MNLYSLAELQGRPTLSQSHCEDLKVQTDDMRVWLSRMTVDDGAAYDNEVTIERLVDGRWRKVSTYEAT